MNLQFEQSRRIILHIYLYDNGCESDSYLLINTGHDLKKKTKTQS
jgi:hypothetical protein